jgi:hypothetical protein
MKKLKREASQRSRSSPRRAHRRDHRKYQKKKLSSQSFALVTSFLRLPPLSRAGHPSRMQSAARHVAVGLATNQKTAIETIFTSVRDRASCSRRCCRAGPYGKQEPAYLLCRHAFSCTGPEMREAHSRTRKKKKAGDEKNAVTITATITYRAPLWTRILTQ